MSLTFLKLFSFAQTILKLIRKALWPGICCYYFSRSILSYKHQTKSVTSAATIQKLDEKIPPINTFHKLKKKNVSIDQQNERPKTNPAHLQDQFVKLAWIGRIEKSPGIWITLAAAHQLWSTGQCTFRCRLNA